MFNKKLYKNKRGQLTIFIILLVLFSLMLVISLFVLGVTVVKINNVLDYDIDVGQVNLAEINDSTFGLYAEMVLNNADWWGLAVIFGMTLGLFLSAYVSRNIMPKWGIILDIFFIFTAFIISLYISSIYLSILDAFASAGETFLEVYTPKTSLFVKNLHIYTVIIGVIMMVLFHSSIPKKSEEKYQKGGYLQGI